MHQSRAHRSPFHLALTLKPSSSDSVLVLATSVLLVSGRLFFLTRIGYSECTSKHVWHDIAIHFTRLLLSVSKHVSNGAVRPSQ